MANACCEQIAQKFDKMISDIKRLPLDKKPTGVLDVTANGTYDAPDNIKGYNRVNVNVPSTVPSVLDTLDVTANGQYTPPAGTDGYNEVNVNVPIPTFTTQEKTATANGDVEPDAGYDGLSKVIVAVPSDVNNEDITIAANGEYETTTPYTGFGKVTVNVPDVPAVTTKLDVTANGTYTPSAGVDGFNEVVVDVPDVPAVTEQLNVTANGTYTPSTGVDGFDEVVVDVPDVPAVTEQLNVTANGTYTPSTGVDGFDNVYVKVPQTPEFGSTFTAVKYNQQVKTINLYDDVQHMSVASSPIMQRANFAYYADDITYLLVENTFLLTFPNGGSASQEYYNPFYNCSIEVYIQLRDNRGTLRGEFTVTATGEQQKTIPFGNSDSTMFFMTRNIIKVPNYNLGDGQIITNTEVAELRVYTNGTSAAPTPVTVTHWHCAVSLLGVA